MTTEQLRSLTEDEQAMLWYMVNKVQPTVIADQELNFELFTSIRHPLLVHRIKSLENLVSDAGKEVYIGLKAKLGIE